MILFVFEGGKAEPMVFDSIGGTVLVEGRAMRFKMRARPSDIILKPEG